MSDRVSFDPHKILQALLSRWRFLLGGALLAAVVAAAGSLMLPLTFSSSAAIMPPLSPQTGFNPLAGASSFSMYLNSLDLGPTQSELFIEILESRHAQSEVIRELDLISHFKLDDKPQRLAMEMALNRLEEMVSTSKSLAGIVTVKVRVKTHAFPILRKGEAERARVLAADIANALVVQLQGIVQDKSTSRARAARMFIESKLRETEDELKVKAADLRSFQERHMAVSLDDQTEQMVEKLAELKAAIMATEVELEVMRRTMTPGNPEIRRREGELDVMATQYDELVHGTGTDSAGHNGVYLPLQDIPGLAQEFAERVRGLKVQEGVFQLLNQLYYEASIEEASDVPLVQVLDEAVPRERKDAPRRSLIVLAAAMLAFVALSARVLVGVGVDGLRADPS